MNPEGEFSDTQSDNTEEVFEHKKGLPIGSAAVFIVAAVCLVVVFWFIYTIWSTPEPTPALPEEVTEPAPDITNIPGRDPKILGLRIDTKLGRLFTLPESGQTLYFATEDCVDTCLEDWTPYTTELALENSLNLGTVEREDGTLQYTWKDKPLYTFNLDTERSVYGDGYNGTWRIARP